MDFESMLKADGGGAAVEFANNLHRAYRRRQAVQILAAEDWDKAQAEDVAPEAALRFVREMKDADGTYADAAREAMTAMFEKVCGQSIEEMTNAAMAAFMGLVRNGVTGFGVEQNGAGETRVFALDEEGDRMDDMPEGVADTLAALRKLPSAILPDQIAEALDRISAADLGQGDAPAESSDTTWLDGIDLDQTTEPERPNGVRDYDGGFE